MGDESLSLRMRRWGKYLKNYIRERAHGLDFSLLYVGPLQRNVDEFAGYSMTDADDLKAMLRHLPVTPSETSILDVGCGKGMCMKCAKELGFRRADGLDLDAHLLDIAKRNMQTLGLDVHCYLQNAADFTGYADYDVFFFYNPFGERIFRQVIQKILDSRKQRDRDIWVVYYHPVHGKLFEDAGFRTKGDLPDTTRDTKTTFYFYPKHENGIA